MHVHQHIEAEHRAPNSGEDPDTPCQLPCLLRPQPTLIVSITHVNFGSSDMCLSHGYPHAWSVKNHLMSRELLSWQAQDHKALHFQC